MDNSEHEYEAYVLETSDSVNELRQLLSNVEGVLSLETMQMWNTTTKKHQDSSTLKIMVCKKTSIKNFLSDHPEYANKVKDYHWSSFPYPKLTVNETTDFHISGYPSDVSLQEIHRLINRNISSLMEGHTYHIKFQVQNRENEYIKSHGNITFAANTPIHKIYLCKLILHHKPVVGSSGQMKRMTVVWKRKKPNKNKTSDKKTISPSMEGLVISSESEEDYTIY